MKRSSFLFITCLLGLTFVWPAAAQEGLVTYEEVIKLEIELPPEMAHMADEIPNSQTNTRHLYFNESEALLKDAPETEDHDESFHGDGGMVRIQTRRVENETYFNFDEARRIDQRDFMGRTFLIEDDTPDIAWKLSGEQSEFLGYMCQKATATVDSTTYEAWFTPEISVPAGPGTGGLPGLILVMNVNDGQRSYVAKALDLNPVEEGIIVPPKKGKKVTQEKFDEIVAEKMKEMDATSGGNTFMIRMRN